MAECHIIGQLVGASDFPQKALFCKWDIHFGPGWKLISGFKEAQTQIDSSEFDDKTYWCHPIDVHLATKGVQGWPKIHVEVYHQDSFGRNELCGYGFMHIPTAPGTYNLTCVTWRPTGSLKEEVTRYFMGGGLQLKRPDVIYSGTDRNRLQTETMGKVYFELGVILRNFHKYGVECFQPSINANLPDLFNRFETCNNEICLNDDVDSYKKLKRDLEDDKFDKVSNITTAAEEVNKNIESSIQHSLNESSNITFQNETNISTELFEDFEDINVPSESSTFKSLDITSDSISEKEISISTLPSVTGITIKNNGPTKSTPVVNEVSYHQFNLTDTEDICFCDLKVNQCDVNCCCDKDCNSNHWKVFVKCMEKPLEYNRNYCFKNNFIFKTNLKLEVLQTEDGLFCIMRDNLRTSLKYKTKGILKSLDTFNKAMPEKVYSYVNKKLPGYRFKGKNYRTGSLIWTLQNGELQQFDISVPTFGQTCSSKVPVRYLVDQVQICSHYGSQDNNECEHSRTENVFNHLKDLIIIAAPHLVNKSLNGDPEKICEFHVCIGVIINVCQEHGNCTALKDKAMIPLKLGCQNSVSKIQYHIWHNGSEGIKKFEAFVWLRSGFEDLEGNFLQTTEVKFFWEPSGLKTFSRSGNPGYLTGKPILSARKVFMDNGTTGKMATMVVSVKGLNVLGSEMGICSSEKRIPINFRENSHSSCSLKLSKDNFGKEKCIELQKYILKLLIGEEVANITNDEYFNKFAAVFGNPKLEDTNDWVQVLIDLVPLTSIQVNFKFGYNTLVCRNIITDLIIDIAYSNVGSYQNPQSKILDLTESAINDFAKPLSLDIKLPHDFFYPFFSASSGSQSLDKFVSGLFLLTLIKIM
ncbi:hypothetical protein RUM43_009485 [Polyplax serrata]|uniref:B9 domain-containing protein 2 n=1 Tax=Polyplax serrata TaxID=468196 RepID=A0AAN8PII2_POLSC